ncbi:MAG: hypothetical protein ACOYOV_05130 [Bacteroidales bacterium]
MESLDSIFREKIAESIINNTISEEIKQIIKAIYKKVFRKEINETCSSCFADAYFELYNLMKSDNQKLIALINCEYELRYGAVLCLFSDTSSLATRNNLTNELAELHLKENPNCIDQFEVFPEDWKERIKPEPEPVVSSNIPDGFPSKAKLIAAGFDTIEKLKSCMDLTSITGIGEVTAQQITDALAAL